MEEAEKLCKTIGIINHGRIVRIGEKRNVLQDKSLEAVFLEVTGSE
jgi:ABC-type multidrug transport system ATPase subunit